MQFIIVSPEKTRAKILFSLIFMHNKSSKDDFRDRKQTKIEKIKNNNRDVSCCG